MTITTSEANPAEDADPSAPSTVVESISAAPATRSGHTEGSMYSCPVCRRAESRET